MAVPTTKLRVPAARHSLVARPRLTARLSHESVPPRLVLASAPAGFGKTTFLSQWLDARPDTRPAWVSLDASDNDPRRFLTALSTSAQSISTDVGVDALGLLETSAAQLPTESVLTSLVNDLDLHGAPAAFVLDDYHLIEDHAVHDATTFLLEHLPGHAILAISTRVDPPLPLARLRGRGELVEIRADDLRFTPAESGSFLTQVMELDLSDSDVNALEARTEGWAAGLQLAGLSMRGQTNPSAFVEAFAGSHRFVLDYLLEEVLRNQPEHVTRFLLDTAVLSEMSAPLCDAVTARGDGQQMLETLERNNMFLIALDDRRRWYRYHHLFADALRIRALTGASTHTDELHRRACAWFAANGQPEEAIEHALAAGDTDRAADLVEMALPENRRGRGDRILHTWLTRIPSPTVRQRPVLSAFVAFTRLVDGDLDGATALLKDAEEGLEAIPETNLAALAKTNPELGRLPGTIEVYRAAIAQAKGDIAGTAAHAKRALETAGPQDHLARSGGAGFLALAAWATGDLETAVDTFDQTVASLHAAGFLADELGTTIPRAAMWLGRGRPDTARRLYEEALEVADRQPAVLSITGDLHVGLADILREHGDLDAAGRHMQIAHELGDAASLPENRHRWHLTMASLEQARGNLHEAADLIEHAKPLFLPGFYPDVRPIPAIMARIRIAQGRLEEASTWARAHDVAADQPIAFLNEFNQLTLVRLLLANHRRQTDPDGATAALQLLEQLLAAADRTRRGASTIEIHMLAALAHQARGVIDPALTRLGLAVAQGVPVGYRRLFLDEGAPMLDLLRLAERRGLEHGEGHVPELLHGSSARVDRARTSLGQEPLSERELEVLRLLATTMTGPDIARQLYLSINTFRTHTKHIFTKLDVKTRAAAVQRATDQGLI